MLRFNTEDRGGDLGKVVQLRGTVRATVRSIGDRARGAGCEGGELAARHQVRSDECVLESLQRGDEGAQRIEGSGRKVEGLVRISCRRRAQVGDGAQQVRMLDFLSHGGPDVIHVRHIAGRTGVRSRSTRAGQSRILNYRSHQPVVVEGRCQVFRHQRRGKDLVGRVLRLGGALCFQSGKVAEKQSPCGGAQTELAKILEEGTSTGIDNCSQNLIIALHLSAP